MQALILHNIRSVHNVGSIFRTADAAGVSKIVLSGYTPAPTDRFGRPRSDFSKVSLGAERTVPWTQVKTADTAIAQLKKEGFFICALEQDARSMPLFEWEPRQRSVALLLGNERRGISKQTLKKADAILEIPMRGAKESLNVSVAAGIAMFHLSR